MDASKKNGDKEERKKGREGRRGHACMGHVHLAEMDKMSSVVVQQQEISSLLLSVWDALLERGRSMKSQTKEQFIKYIY